MNGRTNGSPAAAGAGARPLEGLRVVEMGQLLAGPFCGTVLGYYGAEVIKIEPPQGDPIRTWRLLENGTSLWWYSLGRNKKSVTLDLRQEAGRRLAGRLLEQADVLIENFRPGTLERWGLDPETIRQRNPRLIAARISGYGQTGPASSRPGYASVCEGFGGLRYVTGMPGERPVRSNLSLGDTMAGLHAAMGVLLAVVQRQRAEAAGAEARGQDVDVGIFEAVFNLLEGVVPEFDRTGAVREPSGSTITGIVPTNTYRCRDGRFVIIGGNGDSIYRRLMRAAGRPDLADDPRLADNVGRVAHEGEIDRALEEWTGTLDLDEVLQALRDAEVPAGPIYSVSDMMKDPQYLARGLFETVEAGGRPLKVPAIVPRLSATPGRSDWAGPALGSHNREVYCGLLGLSAEELADLERQGAVGSRQGRPVSESPEERIESAGAGEELPMALRIVEVGPRDGFQMESRFLPTDVKVEIVRALVAAGLREIEATSFVHPRVIPQMRDAERVMARLERHEGVRYWALVPNLRGAERALEAGVGGVHAVICVTETYNQRNVGLSVTESVRELSHIVQRVAGLAPVAVTLAATFGCPFEGQVADRDLVELAARCRDAGVEQLGLADSVGLGHPPLVRRLVRAVREECPDLQLRLHLHDTRGLGLANAMAGLEEGIDWLDSSLGGLGGCPMVRGASGNIATEDLANLCVELGIETGVDLEAVRAVSRRLQILLGRALPSRVLHAGTRQELYDANRVTG